MTQMQWKRAGRGRQVTTCGHWAVETDGYAPGQHVGADTNFDRHDPNTTGYEGFIGGEWATIHHPAGDAATNRNGGETQDWFPTMREAKAAAG